MGPKNAKWIIKSKQSIRDHMCVTLIRSLVTDVHSGGASEPAGRPARVAPPNKELARAMVVVMVGHMMVTTMERITITMEATRW